MQKWGIYSLGSQWRRAASCCCWAKHPLLSGTGLHRIELLKNWLGWLTWLDTLTVESVRLAGGPAGPVKSNQGLSALTWLATGSLRQTSSPACRSATESDELGWQNLWHLPVPWPSQVGQARTTQAWTRLQHWEANKPILPYFVCTD